MKHVHLNLRALTRLRRGGLGLAATLRELPKALSMSLMGYLQNRSPAHDAVDHGTPVFVIGHWRSGTTLLHELLSQDPQFCTPNTYECLYPHHFALTESSLRQSRALGSQAVARPMDGMSVALDSPQEDEFALLSLGCVSMYRWMLQPSQFESCLAELDPQTWSAHDRAEWSSTFMKFLRHVRAIRPGRLLLKSPTHTFRVPLLRELFPDARFVRIVRDPRAVYQSSLRLWREMFALHSTEPTDDVNIAECVMRIGELHDQLALAQWDDLPDSRRVTIRFDDLAADPATVIERLHAALQLPWSEDHVARIDAYVDASSQHLIRSNGDCLDASTETILRARWPRAFAACADPTPMISQ